MAPFRFHFLTDCQLGCYATFSGLSEADVLRFAERDMRVRVVPPTDGFWWDADRYREAIAAANQLRPDLLVVGGDMVDDPHDDDQYAELMRITAELDGIPIHFAAGNHDAAADTVVPTRASLAAYRERFGPDHYAFEHRGTAFVVVDTVVWAHPEQVPEELDRQLSALERDLSVARDRGSDHILVFGHHPLFTADPDEPDSYWNVPRTLRRAILDLLRDHGVRAYFCGHWHRNGGGWYGDLEVVVTGPVGYPLGVDPSGFRIVEVTPEEVRHRYVALEDAVAGTVAR